MDEAQSRDPAASAAITGLDGNDENAQGVLQAYIRELLADYALIPVGQGNPQARALVEELKRVHTPALPAIEANANQRKDVNRVPEWTWEDAYAIEKALAELESIERIRRRLWALRQEYKQLAGDRAYDVYASSKPADLEKTADSELRADLLQLLEETQWLYSTVGVQHHVRDSMIGQLALRTCIAIGLPAIGIVLLTYLMRGVPTVPVLVVVMLGGALGGLISTYRRLQNLPLDGNPAVNLVILEGTAGLTYWAPVFGAMFAVIFYVLIASGLVSGDLFPHIVIQGKPGSDKAPLSFSDFISGGGPGSGMDFAKLLAWSFASGFAERLVPDTIDKLAAAAEEGTKRK